jgi:molybdopterin molybdotransferase
MISVEEALERIFALVTPLGSERVRLTEADGRVLAEPAFAPFDQPPFPSSVMDGYALSGAEVAPGAQFHVIGEAAAGHAASLSVGPGEAVRIFTGAPVPKGADRVVIQEDVTRAGDRITLGNRIDPKPYVRPAGADFAVGQDVSAPRRLDPHAIALLAAMNQAEVTVARRPQVAILATGDELVPLGTAPGPDQIVASNGPGLAALLRRAGARPRLLPIARDTLASLDAAFDLAVGADLIVTIGGASVGDHDLVGQAAEARGMETAFYKVAMRPGKPLMAGRLDGVPMIGLPGNPVSTLVCGHVFLVPAIRAMLGLGAAPAPRQMARTTTPLPPNGPREHYMRATVDAGYITPAGRQDSGLLSVLAGANALLIRPPQDPERAQGAEVAYLPLG